ncbi:MAG: hypothetical protein IKE31_06535 [Eubacterium sp.]|nr:hypothetical protein [Eubacterium sp.]
MAKKRKRKKGENPVREWVSDNLRYLLLILIVVIAALAAFLIYREVSDRRSAAGTVPVAETVETSSTSAAKETPTPTPETETTSSSTEVVTATPTPTETPAPTPIPDAELTEMVPAATEAVQNYFYSLQANGENENVEYYDSIHVQTCPGLTEGTYIAYADYDYKYWNYDAMVPGLTEFYLAPDADGNLQVVSETPSDVQAYIASIRQSESVQELITDVNTRYQEVMDANPELNDFVSGL